MKNNYIYSQLKSCPENEKMVRQIIAHFVADLNPTIDELCDIKTAVSEAVTNAVVHGYANQNGVVFLNAEIIGNELIIEVADKGCGIKNIEEAKQPLFTTQPELERSGMGFTVMETFMDSLEVVSSVGAGTKVVMKKSIGKYE